LKKPRGEFFIRNDDQSLGWVLLGNWSGIFSDIGVQAFRELEYNLFRALSTGFLGTGMKAFRGLEWDLF